LIEDAAVIEELLRGGAPATEDIIDREELQIGILVLVFLEDGRVAGTEEMLPGEVLTECRSKETSR